MKFSIFTPCNDTKYLSSTAASILAQEYQDWEWIILFNGLQAPDVTEFVEAHKDERIKYYFYRPNGAPLIGDLKASACKFCTGSVYVEVDHDDILTPNALAELYEAYSSRPECGFVWSDAFYIVEEGTSFIPFDKSAGWTDRKLTYEGKDYYCPLTPEASAANMRSIHFAPNHVRSFKASLYKEVGGYNRELKVCDDYELMARMYSLTDFHKINTPIYGYRIHGKNNWLDGELNPLIQSLNTELSLKHIESIYTKWASDSGLNRLDIGGGMNKREGYLSVDIEGGDIEQDLSGRWDRISDNQVGLVWSSDTFEHLPDPINTMNELYRIMADGALAIISVPSTDGRGAFQDPSHFMTRNGIKYGSFWNENSFLYYTQAQQQAYIKKYGVNCRFLCHHISTYFPSDWHKEKQISYTTAYLIALKPGNSVFGYRGI